MSTSEDGIPVPLRLWMACLPKHLISSNKFDRIQRVCMKIACLMNHMEASGVRVIIVFIINVLRNIFSVSFACFKYFDVT